MRPFTLNSASLALVAVLLSACGGGFLVRTDRTAYAPGNCVWITVHNPRPATMNVDHCFPPLERQTAEGWELIPPPEDATCLLWGMRVGATDRGGFRERLPAELIDGTYRYTVLVLWEAQDELGRSSSEPFSVSGPAEESPCAGNYFDPDTLKR